MIQTSEPKPVDKSISWVYATTMWPIMLLKSSKPS